jgi:hypothetical protein
MTPSRRGRLAPTEEFCFIKITEEDLEFVGRSPSLDVGP